MRQKSSWILGLPVPAAVCSSNGLNAYASSAMYWLESTKRHWTISYKAWCNITIIIIKQIHTSTSIILFEQRRFHDLIKLLAGATQTETSLFKQDMMLVSVWICLMIMISQQEPSLKQDRHIIEMKVSDLRHLCMNNQKVQKRKILVTKHQTRTGIWEGWDVSPSQGVLQSASRRLKKPLR